ncbi:CrcB family protein [Microbispora sp. NPDC049125]|uniref:fluoride efflux transporter FluC n=1 Tax=Microbispora sp. NPDC049125 TaxID=3154929 RepID=UPI0034670A92
MGCTETGRDVFRGRAAARPARRYGVLCAVALGGGLGSVARYLVGVAIPSSPGRLPWGTFVINVSGSLALGLLMVLVLEVWPPRRYVRPFLGVGFLGGYTTFSTVTAELLGLPPAGAVAYALGSLAAGLAAVWAGMTLARLAASAARRRRTEEAG